MASGFRVSPKYVGPVKLCVFDWAGLYIHLSSTNPTYSLTYKRVSDFSKGLLTPRDTRGNN